MLNETEIAQLDAIIEAHGVVATVRALAAMADSRTEWSRHRGTYAAAEAWSIDAMRLRKFAALLMNGRDR